MSNKKKSLADFDTFSSTGGKVNSEPEQEKVSVILNSNNDNITGSENINTQQEETFLTVFSNKKKPTVEQTHTRATWLVRNDLLKALDELSKGKDRGFRTQLVNYAIEKAINEIRNNVNEQ